MVTLASTNCSTAHWNSRISLVGSDGSISFSTGHPVKVESFTSQNDAEGQVLSNLQEIEKSAQSRTPPTMSYYGTSHVEQLKDFFNAKQRNGSLQMPPTEALRTLAVVQALYRSAEVGKPIDFVDVSPPYRGGII
jgi:predicted dehydrogenase